MSILHYIEIETALDIDLLNEKITRLENAIFVQKSEDLFYYWIDNKSTKGIDLTIENEGLIEVRNTTLSNRKLSL